MIPYCNFHTSLPEVLWSEAVVHHGVVEHRVGCPLHHPCLLSALSANVRKYGAGAEGNDAFIHLDGSDQNLARKHKVFKTTISRMGR